MSTTKVETWVQELADIGPIYPFVGSEVLLVVLLFVGWIGWHIWQIRHEREEEKRTLEKIRQRKGG